MVYRSLCCLYFLLLHVINYNVRTRYDVCTYVNVQSCDFTYLLQAHQKLTRSGAATHAHALSLQCD